MLEARLRGAFRRNAHHYPWLYNWSQRIGVVARLWLRKLNEPDFRALPLFGLPADALCLDVGANMGQSTVSIKIVMPRARVVAFEPNPASCVTLRLVARLLRGVQARTVAIGGTARFESFFVPSWRGIVFDQLGGFDDFDRSVLRETLRGFGFAADVDGLSVSRDRVRVETLDSLAMSPHFIKIDAEGAELEVLQGAARTLAEHRPLLLIEGGHRVEIVDALALLGYRRCVYVDGAISYDSQRDVLNSFFVSRESLRYEQSE